MKFYVSSEFLKLFHVCARVFSIMKLSFVFKTVTLMPLWRMDLRREKTSDGKMSIGVSIARVCMRTGEGSKKSIAPVYVSAIYRDRNSGRKVNLGWVDKEFSCFLVELELAGWQPRDAAK